MLITGIIQGTGLNKKLFIILLDRVAEGHPIKIYATITKNFYLFSMSLIPPIELNSPVAS